MVILNGGGGDSTTDKNAEYLAAAAPQISSKQPLSRDPISSDNQLETLQSVHTLVSSQ